MNTWTLTLQGVKSVRWSQLVGALLLAGAGQTVFAQLSVSGKPVLDMNGNSTSITYGASATSAIVQSYTSPMSWGVNNGYTVGTPSVTFTNPGPVASGANATFTPASVYNTPNANAVSWLYSNSTAPAGSSKYATGLLNCTLTGTSQVCDAGTLTITFSGGPITNPVIHLQDIGGSWDYRSVSHSSYTLTSGGQMVRLSGTPKFQVSGNTIQTSYANTDEVPIGSGSVMVLGTFTSLTFSVKVTQEATPGNSASDYLAPWEGVSMVITQGDPSYTPPASASIPTLSEWAMIFMASLMAMFGIARMRKQR